MLTLWPMFSYASALLLNVTAYAFRAESGLQHVGASVLTGAPAAGPDPRTPAPLATSPLVVVLDDLLSCLETLSQLLGNNAPVSAGLARVAHDVPGTMFTLLRQPFLLGFVRVSHSLRCKPRLTAILAACSTSDGVHDQAPSTKTSARSARATIARAMRTLLDVLSGLSVAGGASLDEAAKNATQQGQMQLRAPAYTIFRPLGDATVRESCAELERGRSSWDWDRLCGAPEWAPLEHDGAGGAEDMLIRICGVHSPTSEGPDASPIAPEVDSSSAGGVSNPQSVSTGGSEARHAPKHERAAAAAQVGLFVGPPPRLAVPSPVKSQDVHRTSTGHG